MTETKKPCCPHCKSENVEGISRIVGYFSKISNWSLSKKVELADRRKGDYKVEGELVKEVSLPARVYVKSEQPSMSEVSSLPA